MLLGGLWGGLEPTSPNLESLVSVVGERRAIEPRLSGGFAFGPCIEAAEPARLVPRRRCAAPPSGSSREQEKIARLSARIGSDLHLAALLRLVWPKSLQAVDQAVAGLEAAAARAPADARVWSDLSAAYFVRSQARDDPRDLLPSLEAAEKAIELDRRLPEARFNRALVLEILGLGTEAWRAWRDYLLLDPDSPW